MHARELVELGALVAAHGTAIVRDPHSLNSKQIEQYWVASKCRSENWHRALKSCGEASEQDLRKNWPCLKATMEEVLASELLVRVWTAVSCAVDQTHGSDQLYPIARSVMVGHLETRNRVLRILVRGRGFSVEDGVAINRVRRRAERWTDMVLGYLISDYDVAEFAFCPERAKDYAADLTNSRYAGTLIQGWKLGLASLRAAFYDSLAEECPNAQWNERVAASILACLRSDLFDTTGVLKSHWLLRLSQVTDETVGLVDDLLKSDAAPVISFPMRG